MDDNMNLIKRGDENWKGYTLEELQYCRAYTAARVEIQRQRITLNIQRLKNGGGTAIAKSWTGRLLSSFSYFDIGLFAFKMGRNVFKGIKRLKR